MQKNLMLMLSLPFMLAACSFPSIFSDAPANPPVPQNNDRNVAAKTLDVQITGGFAGVNWQLSVTEDGYAIYSDKHPSGLRWELQLSDDAFSQLKQMMSDNGIFDLENEYVSTDVADAFLYEITYRDAGNFKSVTTNNFDVPDDLSAIVAGIHRLISDIQGRVPGVGLKLRTSEVPAGDSIVMTITVQNASDMQMTLKFSSGQIFDIEVESVSVEGSGDTDSLVWYWANDMAFTLALWQMDLAVGESVSYEISWDGTDSDGTQLNGDFAISGILVSTPGGRSPAQSIKIIAQ